MSTYFVTKLRHDIEEIKKQTRVITNEQEIFRSPRLAKITGKNLGPGTKCITHDLLPELEHNSIQSESPTEPEIFTTSLPQNIIDDDSAEFLEFTETLRTQEVLSTSQDTPSIIISEQKNNQSKSQNACPGLFQIPVSQ
ncbi:2553_t:CDS:2, partial [Ambispora gerdemannii]